MSELNEIPLKEEKFFDGAVFPLTLAPPTTKPLKTIDDAVNFVAKNKQELLDKLLKHGSILFRGFPIQTPEDFNKFVLTFGWKDLPYIGGLAFRRNVAGVVYTT
jgi:hypothetical protein